MKPVIILLSTEKIIFFFLQNGGNTAVIRKILKSDVFHSVQSYGYTIRLRIKSQKDLFSACLKLEKYVAVLRSLEHILCN